MPDVGFVQLEVRETPFLEVAYENFYLRLGRYDAGAAERPIAEAELVDAAEAE